MTEKTWKEIEGYAGFYEVSDLGRIRSMDRIIADKNGMEKRIKGRLMTPQPCTNGYLFVPLSKNGKTKAALVHRLVAKAFISELPGKPEVNHKDEDKTNNQASNLEWCDHSYNNSYGTLPARKAKRLGVPVKQIKDGVVVAVYPSASAASRATGITQGGISGCCRGNNHRSGGYEWQLA